MPCRQIRRRRDPPMTDNVLLKRREEQFRISTHNRCCGSQLTLNCFIVSRPERVTSRKPSMHHASARSPFPSLGLNHQTFRVTLAQSSRPSVRKQVAPCDRHNLPPPSTNRSPLQSPPQHIHARPCGVQSRDTLLYANCQERTRMPRNQCRLQRV